MQGGSFNLKVVLAGNPNAGKTTLFNTLTGSSLKTGNFHGVTTSPAQKTVKGITYVDVPGAYDFSPYSMEERSAVEEIKSADVIINVIDSLTLENSLNLTRKIVKGNKNTAIYLTKTAQLKRRGGRVNGQKLSAYLGVPVYDCPPKMLKKELQKGINFNVAKNKNIPFTDAYNGGNLKISRADVLFYNNIFSLLFFVAAITLTFFIAFHPAMPGAYLKGLVEELVCNKLCTLLTVKMQHIPTISLLEEGIFGGVGGVLSFIPQIAILYLVLTFLDESGIMSALSFTTDGLFEKVKLSGRAAFSLVSGFGCTAAAILTTRGYTTSSAQRRTIAILPFIPCGAKMPVFLTFLSPLFKNPFPAITCFYFVGVLISLIASMLLKGDGESMLSEVAPICLPSLKTVAIKLCFYLKGFIIKVTGTVMLFCIISWLLSHFSFTFAYVDVENSMLAAISRAALPIFLPMGVTDWRIAYAVLCGFIAKENIAATIALLCPAGAGLSLAATMGVCTFVLLCPACISAFSASCKEAGLKFTLKCFAAQFALALAGGYVINFIFLL